MQPKEERSVLLTCLFQQILAYRAVPVISPEIGINWSGSLYTLTWSSQC